MGNRARHQTGIQEQPTSEQSACHDPAVVPRPTGARRNVIPSRRDP